MKIHSIKLSAFSLFAMSALGGVGCCGSRVSYQYTLAPASNAIFNPVGSPAIFADSGRADWPATYVPGSTGEEILYHEQITDIQGRGFDDNDDFLIRRFESDRYGQTRR